MNWFLPPAHLLFAAETQFQKGSFFTMHRYGFPLDKSSRTSSLYSCCISSACGRKHRFTPGILLARNPLEKPRSPFGYTTGSSSQLTGAVPTILMGFSIMSPNGKPHIAHYPWNALGDRAENGKSFFYILYYFPCFVNQKRQIFLHAPQTCRPFPLNM